MCAKVLFVSNTNPAVSRFGAEQRSGNLLRALINAGYSVDVAYVGLEKHDQPQKTAGYNIVFWNEFGEQRFSSFENLKRISTYKLYPHDSNLAHAIRNIIERGNYEAIICRYLPTAYFCGLEKYADRLIVDMDDVPESALAAYLISEKSDFLHRIYHSLMLYSVKRQTRRLISKCATVFLANGEDARKLGVATLPNISQIETAEVNHLTNNKSILFVGKLDFKPNVEGLNHFFANVWPRVIESVNDAEIIIAGMGLSDTLTKVWSKIPNVRLIGFVEDIKDFYSKGNIVVCPIYTGSGTNIKAIEAMAMGKATLLSKFASKGIIEPTLKDKPCIIAENDHEMAARLQELLMDNTLCRSYQSMALAYSKKYFSLGQISYLLTDAIKDIKSKHK